MQTKPNLAIPTLSLFLLLAGAYTFLTIAMIWSELPYWFVALCLVGLAYGSFTVMHEASHRLLWRKQPNLEIWLGRLASLPLGIPYSVFVYNHMQHHAFANRSDKDPDAFIAGPLWLSLCKAPLVIGHYGWFYVKQIRLRKVPERNQRRVIQELFGLIFINLVLISAFEFINVLMYWWLPAWFATGLLAWVLDWIPHHPHKDNNRDNVARNYNFVGARWLLLGQNLHQVHHAHPQLPWYCYHTHISAEQKKPLE